MPFTFRDPFPCTLGRQCTRDYDQLEAVVKANLGDALSTEDLTTTDAEIRATTLMFLGVKRANLRRIGQGIDPRTLTDPLLARWEAILLIQHPSSEPDHTRRARVAARLLAAFDGGSGSISRAAVEAFSPWDIQVHYNSVATAVTHWPGGTPPEGTEWYSTVANIAIEYIRPVNATDAECATKRKACMDTLDECLPAWATFGFHETQVGDDFHWIIDVSKLDIGVIGDA